MEQQNNIQQESRNFIQKDFLRIFLSTFKNPINGLTNSIGDCKPNFMIGAVILTIIAIILYCLAPLMVMGDMVKYVPASFFVRVAIAPVLFILFSAGLTFVIKIAAGKGEKPDFILDAFVGAIVAIVAIVFAAAMNIVGNPAEMFGRRSTGFTTFLIILLIAYMLIMSVNLIGQSLRVGSVSDTASWWLSPIVFSIAIGLTYVIATA